MNISKKRILNDLDEIEKCPPSHVSAGIIDRSDIYKWDATIIGPAQSPYSGGVFNLIIRFPEIYPFKPPKIKFITRIYHPNIDTSGNICLDILTNKWSPALNISKLLLSIVSLLDDPNIKDPLNKNAANLFIENITEYKKKARLTTIQFAQPK